MSDQESAATAVSTLPPVEKKKRVMSPEALEKLALARKKAAEVKAAMKEAQAEINLHQPKPPKKIDE